MIPRNKSVVFILGGSDSEDEIDIRRFRPSAHAAATPAHSVNTAERPSAVRSVPHSGENQSKVEVKDNRTVASSTQSKAQPLNPDTSRSGRRESWFASLPRNFDLSRIADMFTYRETPTKPENITKADPMTTQTANSAEEAAQDDFKAGLFEIQARCLG